MTENMHSFGESSSPSDSVSPGPLSHCLPTSRSNDPLSILPVEIVLEIFDHLDILATWRLQLVCRKWKQLLGSDTSLRTNMASKWETHDPSDSAGPTPMDTFHSRVRHMQAMRLGRPFYALHISEKIQETVVTRSSQMLCKAVLKGHWLAYIRDCYAFVGQPGFKYTAVVRNIVTGQNFSIKDEARFRCLALSDEILALGVLDGHLFVQSLSEPRPELRKIRLPSHEFLAFSVDYNTVAMILKTADNGVFTAATYDYRTDSLLCFPFAGQKSDTGEDMNPQAVLFDESSQTMHVFSTNTDSASVIGYMRFSQDEGTPEATHSITPIFSETILLSDVEVSMDMIGFAPTGYRGNWTFPAYDLSKHFEYLQLSFDQPNMRLHKHDSCSLRSPMQRKVTEYFSNYRKLTLDYQDWKGLVFNPRIGLFNVTRRNQYGECTSNTLRHGSEKGKTRFPPELEETETDARILMSDTFLVRLSVRGGYPISIFSFDENVRPKDSHVTGLWGRRDQIEQEPLYFNSTTQEDLGKLPYVEDFQARHPRYFEELLALETNDAGQLRLPPPLGPVD